MGGGVALLSGGHVANSGTIEGGGYGNVGYEVGGSCGAGAAGIAPFTSTLVNHGAVLGGSGGARRSKLLCRRIRGLRPLHHRAFPRGKCMPRWHRRDIDNRPVYSAHFAFTWRPRPTWITDEG